MKDTDSEQLARNLDQSYSKFVGARARAKGEILLLIQATREMAMEVNLARGMVRGSFVRWCKIHCKCFDPNEGRAASVVLSRVHTGEIARIETWQLRILRVISPIHHAVRPMAAKRKVKPISWIGAIASAREKINKMVEQAGGVDSIDGATRVAIRRNLDVFDELRTKLK